MSETRYDHRQQYSQVDCGCAGEYPIEQTRACEARQCMWRTCLDCDPVRCEKCQGQFCPEHLVEMDGYYLCVSCKKQTAADIEFEYLAIGAVIGKAQSGKASREQVIAALLGAAERLAA